MSEMQLKQNTTLQNGKYRIINVLGMGGFGITYLAENTYLDKKVAIKEFFPRDYCGRTSHNQVTTGNKETIEQLKRRFIKEAKNLAKLDFPSIVKIYDVFEENDTAYYVMEYIEGETFSQLVKSKGPIDANKAIEYISEVGKALGYIHKQNMTHFDVKPSNIIVRTKDDKPILIDFGLSRQYDKEGEATTTFIHGTSSGFSPIELYSGTLSSFSPQSDVYSLAATLYYLVVGKTPPPATELITNAVPMPEEMTNNLKTCISKGMNTEPNNRPSSVEELLNGLKPTKIIKFNFKRTIPFVFIGMAVIIGLLLLILIGNGKEDIIIEDEDSVINGIAVKWNDTISDNEKEAITEMLKEMVLVAGGHCKVEELDSLGSVAKEKMLSVDSFYMGKYEISQEIWESIMGNTPSFNGEKGNYPVERVSWTDCNDFITKINELSGLNFRLPTEDEWIFAAVSGKNYKLKLGADSLYSDKYSWTSLNSKNRTHSKGELKPNGLGIYDMMGNVWEWTSTKFSNQLSEKGETIYVRKGGSFKTTYFDSVLSRYGDFENHSAYHLGFRLVLTE